MVTFATSTLGYQLTKRRATVLDYPNLLFAHHTCYTVMLVLNAIVISVFWTILWRKIMFEDLVKLAGGNDQVYFKLLTICILNHTVPGLSALLLMTINDTILLMNRIKVIFAICVFYVSFNWYSVQVKGHSPTYHFMAYDGWQSWATIIGICTGAVIFYYCLTKFDQKLKKREVI